jgi:hypothetical protein
MTVFKALDVSEQLAQNAQASRSREARDQKYFVQSLFKEIEILKQQNSNISAELADLRLLLREALGEKKPKKAALEQKAE